MPEIPAASIINASREIKMEKAKTEGKVGFVDPAVVKEIINRNSLTEIGSGAECIVVSSQQPDKRPWYKRLRKHTNDKSRDVVVAFDYQELKGLRTDKTVADPEEAKRRFYTYRILSTLFPHNFPHFYAYFASQEIGDISGSVRHRIPKKTGLLPTKINYPFSEVTKVFAQLGWDQLIFMDTADGNFIVGADGGQYYADKARIYSSQIDEKLWNTDKVIRYMHEKKFSQTDQRIVLGSIARIQQLQRAA